MHECYRNLYRYPLSETQYALIMAAVLILGVFVMTILNSTVAQTVYKMVDFGTNSSEATLALCAGMVAIVLWATVASFMGIPTSESHALIAGLSGAAIGLHGSFAGINGSEWIKVIYGLVLSTVMGFGFGFLAYKLVKLIFQSIDRRRTQKFFRHAQVLQAAHMALCTELKTDKNLSLSLCWASHCLKEKQGNPFLLFLCG